MGRKMGKIEIFRLGQGRSKFLLGPFHILLSLRYIFLVREL